MTDKLKSKREVGGQFYSTPINKVEGFFEGYEVEERIGKFAKPGQKDVILKITNIEEVEADSAYPYKTAQIRMKFSDSATSSWVLLENSIADVLGISEEAVSIDDAVSSEVVLEKEKEHTFFVDKEGKASQGVVWTFTSINQGKTKAKGSKRTAAAHALELLNGKTKEAFETLALEDKVIRKDTNLLTAILGGQFYSTEGVTLSDDGFYTVA